MPSPDPRALCQLLQIDDPIIQAGMVWVSGGRLAAASANAGVLGVIGAGSMAPELLRYHIDLAKSLTSKSLAVNVPLLYPKAQDQIQAALDAGIRIFITSAGSPRKFTEWLKKEGCTVVHVVSHPVLAKKCEDAGVDAVVAEGFEAGGHNGRDEITTMALIPQVVAAVDIPVVAAGGIASGAGIVAAIALGASGVQMGTRFIATLEASAHDNFKKAVVAADAGATMLCMKDLVAVRLLKNPFFEEVRAAEKRCASAEELQALLGKGRARAGMLEGDWERGELEVGQICGLVDDLPSVAELVARLRAEVAATQQRLIAPFMGAGR